MPLLLRHNPLSLLTKIVRPSPLLRSHLIEGTLRFSQLARTIGGVSEKMLAQTLQALEMDGLLTRTVYPTIPPKVEYSLTKLGSEVAVHVRALTNWVEQNVSHVLKHRATNTKAASGLLTTRR